MLLGGGGCCAPNFPFIILHCPVIPLCQEKTPLPSFTHLGGIDIIHIYTYFSFKKLFYHPSFYQPMLLGGEWMLHAKLFFYHLALPCHFKLSGKTTLPLFTSLKRDCFYIDIYIYIFLSKTSSIILHVSPTPHF